MSVDNGYSDHEKSNIEENLTQLQGNIADQDNLDLEIKQEKVIHTNDVFIPSSIMMIDNSVSCSQNGDWLMASFKATNTQNVPVFFHAINNESFIVDHDKK